MKMRMILSLAMILIFAACTRSFGPLATPVPSATPTQPPADQPGVQVTLSPPPTNTAVPTSEPAEPTAPPATAEPSPQPTLNEATPTEAATTEATQPPPTEAPIDTPSVTPTATSPPFDARAALGSPKFTDPMTEGSFRNWSRDNELPDTDNIRLELEDGKLSVTGKNPFFDTWWFSWPTLDDFFLELSVETGTCSGKDTYGVIFRGPPRDFGDTFGYQAVFSCDGEYQVRRVDGADPYTIVELTPWTKNVNIKDGANQTNVLGIRAEGNTLTLFANGFEIAKVSDGEYDRGRYGVFVSAGPTQNFTYEVPEIVYWELN